MYYGNRLFQINNKFFTAVLVQRYFSVCTCCARLAGSTRSRDHALTSPALKTGQSLCKENTVDVKCNNNTTVITERHGVEGCLSRLKY